MGSGRRRAMRVPPWAVVALTLLPLAVCRTADASSATEDSPIPGEHENQVLGQGEIKRAALASHDTSITSRKRALGLNTPKDDELGEGLAEANPQAIEAFA